MGTTKISSVSKETKSKGNGVPKGATILSKNVRIDVEEIMNGYIITKNYDIKYKSGDDTSYSYYSEKYYTEEDPLQIDTTNKALADMFD